MFPTRVGLMLWLMSSLVASKLPDGIYELALDEDARHKLFWALDYENSNVKFEIHAHISKGEWFAFGFSDRGDMENGDYCVYQPRKGIRSTLVGVWTDDKCIANAYAEDDDICGSFNYVENEVLKFTFTRPFQMCSQHHYQIEDGTTHIVWSRGSGTAVGRRLCGRTEQGMTRVQLLKTEGIAAPHPPSTWTFTPTVKNVRVPDSDTTYWCHTVRLPDRLKQKHHVIQAESHLSKGNEGLVHHMEFFHCEVSKGTIPQYSGPCDDKPAELKACSKVITAWAMGATPFTYPKEAGLPIGGPDYTMYAMLEIHYNNPSMSADWVDSSGFKIFLTSDLRPNDAGVIELGLEYVDKMAIPPQQKLFPLSGYCISECTNSAFPQDGITVFGSQLHTHLTGVMLETRHIRNGVELPRLNYDYHYSPHFQEIRLLKKEITVLPGDALITTCYYNTMDRVNVTLGGFATTDEMCVDYIYYYPKVDLEVCKSSISDDALASYFDSNKMLENQVTGSDLPISEAYKGIEWNPLRVKILQALYEDSPIFMQCNDSAGRRLPGDWSHMQKSAALQTKNRDSNRCYDDVSKVVNVEKTTRRKDNDNDQQKMYLAKRKDSSRKRGEHVRRGSSRQDRSRHSMRKRMDFFFGHVPN
ncbi:tyramine beta hydroxylase [Nesidiocoris tenuis]|uniref:Tyramine beta hydroxylase n=1 Tax=Nesidiocoris tenuis TaxID=355587 RepID=A0ABN7B9F2_9HEMI|nr:tyramine beta hydroxylase [Nesidiocoris tenuis]